MKTRGNTKRPDTKSIYKELSRNTAIITIWRDVEEKFQLLMLKFKIENKRTKQDLDSSFIITEKDTDPIKMVTSQ